MENELSTPKFLVNEYIEILIDLVKNQQAIFNNTKLLEKLDFNEIIISVLQFFNEKLISNSENRNFLNIVESLLLLEENKGNFILDKEDEFDFEKYHQNQSTMNIHDYNLKIIQKLSKFRLFQQY